MTDSVFRIGLVSDTHGSVAALENVAHMLHGVDLFIHAGDFYSDSLRLFRLTGIPSIGVVGNCDREISPSDEFVELEGRRFFITHGHLYGVKASTAGLVKAALGRRAHIVIYGHTHIPIKFVHRETLFINPGSAAAGRRGHGRSCALLTLTPAAISVDFLPLPI